MHGTAPLLVLALALAAPLGADGEKQDAALPPPRTYSIDVQGTIAYVGQASLVTFDVSDPAKPKQLGTLYVPGKILGVTVDGTRCYLAAGARGMYIVDVSEPTDPELLGSFDTTGGVRQIVFHKGNAYLAQGSEGLQVLDVSLPERPRRGASLRSRHEVRAVAIHDDLLALAEGHAGVRLFELTHTGAPLEIAALDSADGASDVAFLGDLLLVAAGRRGLLVYRLQRNDEPALLAELPFDDSAAMSLAVDADTVLVTDGESDLHLVGLAEPAAPRLLATAGIHRGARAGHVTVVDGVAYVAADIAGIAVIDVSDPATPKVLVPRERTFNVRFPGAGDR